MFSFYILPATLAKGFVVCFSRGMQTALFTCLLNCPQEKGGRGEVCTERILRGKYTCPRTHIKKSNKEFFLFPPQTVNIHWWTSTSNIMLRPSKEMLLVTWKAYINQHSRTRIDFSLFKQTGRKEQYASNWDKARNLANQRTCQ